MKLQNSIRPFPARVAPLPGESLLSLIRRTSEAMGYESIGRVVAILADRGRLPPHLNQLVPGRVCNYLAALVHQSTETLSSLSVHHYAPSLVLLPENQPPVKVLNSSLFNRIRG